jgi:hypothetical protein
MSLIPSESANFPDSFRANVGWRLPKKAPVQRTRAPRRDLRPSATEIAGRSKDAVTPPNAKSQTAVAALAEPEAETNEIQLELLPGTMEFGIPGGGALLPPEVIPQPAATGVSNDEQPASPAADSLGDPATSIPHTKSEEGQPAVVTAEQFQDALRKMMAAAQPVAISEMPAETTATASAIRAESEEAPAPTPSSVSVQAESPARADNELPRAPAAEAVTVTQSPVAETGAEPIAMTVETPSQAQHILELIAAAVQRGALVSEPMAEPAVPAQPLSQPAPPAPPEPEPARAPEPTFSAPFLTEPAPLPVEQGTPGADQSKSPVSSVPPAADAPKNPARIRITPRKIKPRQPVEEISQPVAATAPVTTGKLRPDAPITETTQMPIGKVSAIPGVLAPTGEASRARLQRADLPGRNFGGARPNPPRANIMLIAPQERRNRWIGFGLSEAAAVTALILLSRFGFTHHFPDPTLKLLVFILIIAALGIAVALPIAFLRNNPARWQR